MDWLKAHKTQVQRITLVVILASSVVLYAAAQNGAIWLAMAAFVILAAAFMVMTITP